MRVGDGILATFKDPARSHQLGKKAGPRSSCRSVRHLNDKKKPDHWRAGSSEALNELRLLAFATDSALQRLQLRPRHASLIGGDPRSSSGSLAKFAAIRRASSLRQPICSPSDTTRNRGRRGSARLALETTLMTLSEVRVLNAGDGIRLGT